MRFWGREEEDGEAEVVVGVGISGGWVLSSSLSSSPVVVVALRLEGVVVRLVDDRERDGDGDEVAERGGAKSRALRRTPLVSDVLIFDGLLA